MGAREDEIIDAATGVLSRYGLKRTTMADIATAAGISRQTLYASFPSKEDLFAGAVRRVTRQWCQAIEAAWAQTGDPAARIDAYLDIAVHAYFDQIRSMPDFQDLASLLNESGKQAKQEALEAKRAALERLFTPYADALARAGTTPRDLAEYVQSSAESLVYAATDGDHLRRLTRALSRSVVALLKG